MKQAESDQIVVALRDLKRPVDYVVAPDEGHGFRGKENRLAMFAMIEAFLAKHLGGRFQKGAAPEIEERIKVVGEPLLEIKRAIAVSKGNEELLARLDRAVGEIVGSDAYGRIFAKWYGTWRNSGFASRLSLKIEISRIG